MKMESFDQNVNFNDLNIVTKVILETSFTKEIRILLKKGQNMKEHKAPFPIIVHVLSGEINFGVEGTVKRLKRGDIITLLANVAHDLTALDDSIIRLTLSKPDQAERVKNVAVNP